MTREILERCDVQRANVNDHTFQQLVDDLKQDFDIRDPVEFATKRQHFQRLVVVREYMVSVFGFFRSLVDIFERTYHFNPGNVDGDKSLEGTRTRIKRDIQTISLLLQFPAFTFRCKSQMPNPILEPIGVADEEVIEDAMIVVFSPEDTQQREAHQFRFECDKAWGDLRNDFNTNVDIELCKRFFEYFSFIMVQLIQVFQVFKHHRVGAVGRPQPSVLPNVLPTVSKERFVINVDPSIEIHDPHISSPRCCGDAMLRPRWV